MGIPSCPQNLHWRQYATLCKDVQSHFQRLRRWESKLHLVDALESKEPLVELETIWKTTLLVSENQVLPGEFLVQADGAIDPHNSKILWTHTSSAEEANGWRLWTEREDTKINQITEQSLTESNQIPTHVRANRTASRSSCCFNPGFMCRSGLS